MGPSRSINLLQGRSSEDFLSFLRSYYSFNAFSSF